MLTIRLRRTGSKKRARFRVVVIDARAARDGRFIEVLGHYNPQTQPEVLHVDHERVAHWLQQGARPSNTVRTLLARHPVVAGTDAAPVAAEGQPPS